MKEQRQRQESLKHLWKEEHFFTCPVSAAPADQTDVVGKRLHAESAVKIRTGPRTGAPVFFKVHAAGLHLHIALNDGEDPMTGQIILQQQKILFFKCQPG